MFGKKDKTEKDNKQQCTPEESKLLYLVTTNQQTAESARGTSYTDYDSLESAGVETIWEDEYKMLIGDQWSTSFAYRTRASRKTRPNSVDNFIFPAIMNAKDNICVSTPEVVIEPTEDGDEELAEKLTYLSQYNDGIHRNNFKSTWKKMVQQFIAYGPIIGAVLWDNDWMGGRGPNRWIGDVRILHIDRRDIFFDPAIIDLEDRMQECSFVNRRFRKKLSYIMDKWENGKYVSEENNENDLQDEGGDPKQAYLIEGWHRGLPAFVPPEKKKKFLEKAQEYLPPSANPDPYKAQDYKDMAEGKLKGIHCAYVANNVFLDYEPYVYDDGLYPFVYKTCYYDENSPYGFGEIRNIKIPQVMHNKADEIEIEAMSRQGLGGQYYTKGSVTPKQKVEILKNNGKGGEWLEVDNIHGLKEREGVETPESLIIYKNKKQEIIETVSSNTPIQQGLSPGANVPYSTIQELGARTDVRTKAKVEILEDFLIDINKLRINRFAQFYTEDRYYRLKGQDGNAISGTFSNSEMFKPWDREKTETETKVENFVPEFDINVKIMDEKPTDRNYYVNTALTMFKGKGMTLADLWYTIEEGKFPNKDDILEHVENQDEAVMLTEALNKMQPEQKQQIIQMIQQAVQQQSQNDVDAFLDSLPDEQLAQLQQLPAEQRDAAIKQMMGGAQNAQGNGTQTQSGG